MATVNSSANRPLPTTYRFRAHSKSAIAPLTISDALAGVYSVSADSVPGFDCWRLVISVQAPATMAKAEQAATIRRDLERFMYVDIGQKLRLTVASRRG